MSPRDAMPILWNTVGDWRRERMRQPAPAPFPMALLAPHERQAQRNHYQSLQRLAERGGLSPSELAAVLEDRPWRRMSDQDALAIVDRRRHQGALTGPEMDDRG